MSELLTKAIKKEVKPKLAITETAPPPVTKLLEQAEFEAIRRDLADIKADLAEFREMWKKKEELLDTELRIARLFEGMLQKQSENAKKIVV